MAPVFCYVRVTAVSAFVAGLATIAALTTMTVWGRCVEALDVVALVTSAIG